VGSRCTLARRDGRPPGGRRRAAWRTVEIDPVVAPLATTLTARVVRFVDEHRLPGASVGIVRDDSLVWVAGVGYADFATGARPNERTLYRIASITKTFTATGVLQLRDEGRLRLDDPLTRFVPEFAVAANPFGPIEDVTIRRLLLHRSGLQSEQPVMDPRKATFVRVDDLIGMLDRVRVSIPPESAFKYSNLGYELLGEVVRRVSGHPLTEYVADRITGPLGMTSTVTRRWASLLNAARSATTRGSSMTVARSRVTSTRSPWRAPPASGRRLRTWPAGSPSSSAAAPTPSPRAARCFAVRRCGRCMRRWL